VQNGLHRPRRGPVDEALSPTSVAGCVVRLIDHDPQQPRPEPIGGPEPVQGAVRRHKRLLHHVIGVVTGAAQQRRPFRDRAVASDQDPEEIPLTPLDACDDVGVVRGASLCGAAAPYLHRERQISSARDRLFGI
jgi:hypothetical protein